MELDGTNCVVRLAGPQDSAAVARLLVAIEAHYLGQDRTSTVEDAQAMVGHAFETAEGTRFAVAEIAGEAVGIACFAILRPGHLLEGLVYLKELFVVDKARGQGVGAGLMAFLASFAREHGLGRIDFTTDAGNDASQRLYEGLGATRQPKVAYRLEGEALDALARKAAFR